MMKSDVTTFSRWRQILVLSPLLTALLCCCSCQWAGAGGPLPELALQVANEVVHNSRSTAEFEQLAPIAGETRDSSPSPVYTLSSFEPEICGPVTDTISSPCVPGSGDAAYDPNIAGCHVCTGADQAMASIYSDEYLCDGGDQGPHVRVRRDWNVNGLDPEDTVAHYDTLDGRTIVTPSNSVCIYAPRFAAVRQVVHTSEDGLLLAMQSVNQPLPPITDQQADRATGVDLPLPVQRELTIGGPIALRARTRGLEFATSLPVHELVNDFAAHEDFQVIRTGIERRSQRVDVEKYADAAVVWTEGVQPEVMLDAEPAEVDVTVDKVGTEYHIGLEGTPRIRVIKLASTSAASPGEEVTFTLRFDNVGDQTIGNVTILDNLTTRLEFVPDSAECSLKAEFFHDENDGHSLALRWEIRDPINPGDGGVIRFRCKVR